MVFLKFFQAAGAIFLLGRIARADARSLRIPARENCMLAACSLARATAGPAGWAESAAAAVLFCGAMAAIAAAAAKKGPMTTAGLKARRPPMLPAAQPDRFLIGGGDIKLVFAILLQMDIRDVPPWGVTACLYILLTRAVWPDKRRLPLGPALGGACACVLLGRLCGG
jgi:Flp pilus assembly protein protease CpaA